MSQVSDHLNGLTLDEGVAFFVKEDARSESGVASITNVQMQTTKFMGSQVRTEYLMPMMTDMIFGTEDFEAELPRYRLMHRRIVHQSDPIKALAMARELIAVAGGSASVSAVRVIKVDTVMPGGYRTAESLRAMAYGWWDFTGFDRDKKKPLTVKPMTRMDFHKIQEGDALGLQVGIPAGARQALFEIDKIASYWADTGLGERGVLQALDDKDARAIARRLKLYVQAPEWSTQQLKISESGQLTAIDDRGLDTLDPKYVKRAFPPSPYNIIYFEGEKKNMQEWPIRHNTAVREKLKNDVLFEKLDAVPDAKSLRRRTYILRTPGSSREVSKDDLIKELTEVIADGKYALFKGTVDMTQEGAKKKRTIVEFGYTADDAEAFKSEWRKLHSAYPAAIADFKKTARRILAWREVAAVQVTLKPAIVERLHALASGLSGESDVMSVAKVLKSLSADVSTDDLSRAINLVKAMIDKIRETYPKLNALTTSDSPAAIGMENGLSVITAGRFAPTDEEVTVSWPIKGDGPAPIVVDRKGNVKRILKGAVVLNEPPVTVVSPIASMMSTAYLLRVLEQIDGRSLPPGMEFDEYSDKDPMGDLTSRPSPHVLLNRQLERYETAVITAIEAADVSQMPELLKQVQQIADAKLFLRDPSALIDSIILRDDWILMLQSLLLSAITTMPHVIESTYGTERVDAGVLPIEATKFLFGEVMDQLIKRPAYRRAVSLALSYGVSGESTVLEQTTVDRAIRGEVLLARARNGAALLLKLLDGSCPEAPNIAVDDMEQITDVDDAKKILQTLNEALASDFLALVNSVEFETPWDAAWWNTQFTSMLVTVSAHPIAYDAVDVTKETALDAGMVAVQSAIKRAGFTWREIAPACLRVYADDLEKAHRAQVLGPRYMRGYGPEGSGNGVAVDSKARVFYNDAPISHQGLKVTMVCPSYDAGAYNLLHRYLVLNTSRTYFVQPVDRDISDQYTIKLSGKVDKELIDAIIGDDSSDLIWDLKSEGWTFEKSPALADVALLIPYRAKYLEEPVEAEGVAIRSRMQIKPETSLAITSGVTIIPSERTDAVLSRSNGISADPIETQTISSGLSWVGE